MITVTRVVLLCALISVALTASVLAPKVSTSIAEINSHSVQVNLPQNGIGQGTPQVGHYNVTLYEDGNVCGVVVVIGTQDNTGTGFWSAGPSCNSTVPSP